MTSNAVDCTRLDKETF